jgi:hypothetical protein
MLTLATTALSALLFACKFFKRPNYSAAAADFNILSILFAKTL